MKKLYAWFFKKWVEYNKPKKHLAHCGHECSQNETMTAFGETIESYVSTSEGYIKYCHKCLEKMAILCPWCNRPIFIGDAITLHTPNNTNFVISEGVEVYQKDPLQLIGCQRSDCAKSMSDYCGQWIPPGKVWRYQSAIEVAISNPGYTIAGSMNKGKHEFKIIKDKEFKDQLN
jgi:hypothetical protein